jgi:hypothetical protein
MAHPFHHALSSAKKWGGSPEDYLLLHQWLDLIWTIKRRLISLRQGRPSR